jgi:hypothetical protein
MGLYRSRTNVTSFDGLLSRNETPRVQQYIAWQRGRITRTEEPLLKREEYAVQISSV